MGEMCPRFAFAAAACLSVASCASVVPPPPRPREPQGLVMAHDDARPTGTMAFPSLTYESVVRFELPVGEHRPLRVHLLAEAPGQLEITIYDSTIFETPGEPLRRLTRELAPEDLSNGRDGRWVVEDLVDMKPVKGVIWIGVRKTAGTPTIWASGVVSGQAFVRNNDPQNPMGLLPTKRTPMVRVEVAP